MHAHPQPLTGGVLRGECPHVVQVRKYQGGVVIRQPDLERAGHREFAQLRRRRATGVHRRYQHGQRVTGRQSQPLGDHLAHDDAPGAGSQIRELSLGDGVRQLGRAAGGPRVDATQQHRQHLGAAHGECLQLRIGRHAGNPRDAQHRARGALPVRDPGCGRRACRRRGGRSHAHLGAE